MLKETSEEKQNNSAEKISMNGSLWAEWCPAPRCCTRRKKTEGTVSLLLRSGAAGAGSRHIGQLYTPGCKEQGSWELTVLAENPRKQHSKNREKILPWYVMTGFLVEPLTQEEGSRGLAVPSAPVGRVLISLMVSSKGLQGTRPA